MVFTLCFDVDEDKLLREFALETHERMNGKDKYNLVLTGECWIQELTSSLMLVVIIKNKLPVWLPFRKRFFAYGLKKGLRKKGYLKRVVRLKDQEALRRLLNAR